MTVECKQCDTPFINRRQYRNHLSTHFHPKPPSRSTYRFHPHLNGRPCDVDGNFLAAGDPPPPREKRHDFDSFGTRTRFETAELLYEEAETARPKVDKLLRIWAAQNVLDRNPGKPPFKNYDEMVAAIDGLSFGGDEWYSFTLRHDGPVEADAPAWKRRAYTIHARNPLTTFENQLANPTLKKKFDRAPLREYTRDRKIRYSNFNSGRWAWREATKISADEETHGAMLVAAILGADKTTVSVGTGDQEFHPLYASASCFHNDVRRGHSDVLAPIAFLAIPKGTSADDTEEFRIFKKQLYHDSIKRVLDPLKPYMTTPRVTLCPDGHYRKVIYSVGPFIADYPEQVYLTGIVSGWCPKCLADLTESDAGRLRTPEVTEHLCEMYDHDPDILWDAFGIAPGVTPFTEHFPRADIHELTAPDLLHQVIKGTFKDHLVEWVLTYIRTNNTKDRAAEIIADIDERLRCCPAFPGLRRFKQGRNFKQWTGNDSKALMKVFLPAIVGYVPDRVVQAICSFMDFCSIARLSAHTEASLLKMEHALGDFRELREVFREEDIREHFALPRQHALVHYAESIRLFGAPNGISTSITESAHIRAVKRPWRRSNKNHPLLQILKINERMSKLRAARAEFASHGLFHGGDVLEAALLAIAIEDGDVSTPEPSSNEDTSGDEGTDLDRLSDDDLSDGELRARRRDRRRARGHRSCSVHSDSSDSEDDVPRDERHDVDVGVDLDTEPEPPSIRLARKYDHSRKIHRLKLKPRVKAALPGLIRRYLYNELYADDSDSDSEGSDAGELVDIDECPPFDERVAVYRSARATFYAPSELSGPGGMHSEIIRSTPRWYGRYERRDTVLVQVGDEDDVMGGMLIARVLAFISFEYNEIPYSCAVVEWYMPMSDEPDPLTGMWIVEPELDGVERTIDLIDTDSIIRACHLVPKFGTSPVPDGFHFAYAHNAYKYFYFNKYSDYHTYETYPL
ncbi:hypothetical protein PENSPDRAFT_692611 [Peniophora sp. CONT]|nr:hypothetical protein PENSPDRAFT_692611 [Peniophora sp. CONT]